MEFQNLALFAVASFLLAITPGNDMLFVISQSLSRGFRGGFYSIMGIYTGCFVHITASMLGLAFIITQSVFAFELIKYAGAAYLIYLGIRALISKAAPLPGEESAPVSRRSFFVQGMVTNLLNPKVAIFILSFLPQFIDPASSQAGLQFFLLGTWFNTQGALLLTLVALATSKSAGLLKRHPRFWAWQGRVTAVMLIGLGVKLLFTSRN